MKFISFSHLTTARFFKFVHSKIKFLRILRNCYEICPIFSTHPAGLFILINFKIYIIMSFMSFTKGFVI